MALIDVNNETLGDLKEKLKSDAYTAVKAARMAAELERAENVDTKVVVTIYDKFYTPMYGIDDYINMQCSFPRNQVETGSLTLARNDPAAEVVLTCNDTTVPITIEINNLLWSGRVKVAHDNFGDSDQADTVECELEGDYAWLLKILAWPNFLLPITIQFPGRGVAIGPVISVMKYLLGTQTFRLQSGMYDLINNLSSLNLDWRSWFSTFLMQDLGDDGPGLDDLFRMLRTPIYVVPTAILTDTSPFVAINWRMDKIATIFDQQAKDNGLSVEVNLWRPGDPQPGSDPLLTLYPLTVPTIVVDIKDRKGIVGPTGTFLDGILKVAVDLEGSLFGEILQPFLNPSGEYAPEGWNIAPLLGVHFVEPWTIFNADHKLGGVSGRISHHTPECWRVIIGGKSPKWLNDLINATFSWIVDMITIIIGIAGFPSNLFDGFLNNVAFAFQMADNFERRVAMGPYGHPEIFVPTGHAPYNVDAVFAMKREMYNTRGFVSGQVSFRNGEEYTVGYDISPNGLVTIIRNSEVYTDYVENIVITDSRDERCEVQVQVGDGQREEAPVVAIQRKLIGYSEAINALMLAPE